MLVLIPLFPLIGFGLLALGGRYFSKRIAATVGCASIAASGIITASVIGQAPAGLSQNIGTWIEGVGPLFASFSFWLDPLSATMVGVVCGVGLLIHLYSVEYMADDEGFARFFAYLNLFVSMMLILLLAEDLLLLFLGWEGVGLCSYLLIGFWYRETANGHAAQKAFIVTRIGDVAFMIALFVLWGAFGTWSIPTLTTVFEAGHFTNVLLPTVIALLLLGAAVGKSGQLPLHVWLPDAMAGPTPVSALIHAATMVTAGVYLIARLHSFFLASPEVLLLVGGVGAITALYAAITALGQNDIKRVLAYSTISQIGYMFLGLGTGAFGAAIFHFMTHAFFKALLFLGAGAVIHAAHGEQDMRQLGGLRTKLPVIFWTFVIGSGALAALPLVTAGFYSKDAILWGAYAGGHFGFWSLGILTAGLTGLYTTRMVLMTFFGSAQTTKLHPPGWLIKGPLVILAFFAIVAGFVEIPHTLGGWHPWSDWIEPVFSRAPVLTGSFAAEMLSQTIAAVVSLAGIGIGILFFVRLSPQLKRWAQQGIGKTATVLSATGFYWDQTYQLIFVRGFQTLTKILRPEWIDSIFVQTASFAQKTYAIGRATQSGRIRWYAIGFVVGVLLISAGVLWQ